MQLSGTIFVAGHRGLVGSAIVRALERAGFSNIVTRSRKELDLCRQEAVESFFAEVQPQYVCLAAAKVGGVLANNTRPAEFGYENLVIQANIIHSAWRTGTERLLFLGSSCIYPRLAPQPMNEAALLTGTLEPTNEPYAVAKIAGIKLCESYRRQYGCDYRSLMPTNLYGPGDNFDLSASHVIPALLRKFHEAKCAGSESVEVWGSGLPRREFLHVDDLANASVYFMSLPEEQYWGAVEPMCSHVNIGTGTDVTIAELAQLVKSVVGFSGSIRFDASKPDGAPRKLLDVERANRLGWNASLDLRSGLEQTYAWYCEEQERARK